jgi:hypothetical protein
MYVTDGSNININMLYVGEGTFKWNQASGQPLPEIELVMGLGNSQSSETYGSCKVGSPLLSKDTVEKFMDFLKSAEEDFGEVVFRGVKPEATITPGTSNPETQTGLGGK